MLEPLRDATPTIYLLLRQLVNVVADFLMGDQHDVHLEFSATITLFRKVLQHFCIADRSIGYIGFEVFGELIVDEIDAGIATSPDPFDSALIEAHRGR